ncbi:MAG TPA: SDR family oxidoreductase [Gemmatimonadaceae bacterium]|jgi:Putative dehydrogenase domain of multifunctional non-ribosomal peptide synthetases and related enzymes
MTRKGGTVLITGATGHLGCHTLDRLLEQDSSLEALALVRDPARWSAVAASLGRERSARVAPVIGELRSAALGLSVHARAGVMRATTTVIHLAADTTFSRPLPEARAINTDGTSHALELAGDCRSLERFVYVSTAFVAGRMTGSVPERDNGSAAGWVNAYEQSKYEAEALVRESGLPWLILRPSTVVCEGLDGSVGQFNVVHRALRLYHHGLAAMMPGSQESPVDVVTSEYVSDAIARLALHSDIAGRTVHLCAGGGALPLGELLDITYDVWAAAPGWRRRSIERPALADAETYRLFEGAVEETGDLVLRRVIHSLSHFVPHLALEKRFETRGADALLGHPAPRVRDYWRRMVEYLVATDWGSRPEMVAA